MFIYVFNEDDRSRIAKAGFPYYRQDANTNAWIFIKEQDLDIPEGVSVVVSPKLLFHGQKDSMTKGGGHHGKE